MVWFYIFGTLLTVFFLLRNIVSEQTYQKYKQEAVFVFDDERIGHKIYRIVFCVLLVLFIIFFLFLIVYAGERDFETVMLAVCMVTFCSLHAFFPYSQAKWIVTADGVFLYNYNLFIRWSEMAAARPVASGKRSYLMIHLLGDEQNLLKKKEYPVLLKGEKVPEMQSMFREFISLEDKRRHKLRLEAEKASREANRAASHDRQE